MLKQREWLVKFEGTDVKTQKRVKKNFRVRALDTYSALDALNEQHGLRDRFVNSIFKFGEQAQVKISSAAFRRAVNATPEEE